MVDRVRATLRRALDRDELPDIPLLCAEEVDRACAPWGLLAEDKQATLVAGIEVAVDLAPLRESAVPRYDLARHDPGPAAQGGLRPARPAIPGRGRAAAPAAAAGDRRPRRLRAPVHQQAVGPPARTRRLAGTVRRRRRRQGPAGGRRQIGEPGSPAADQGDAGTSWGERSDGRYGGGPMRFVADSGLWSTGPTVAAAPAVAVLELSGAVLAWTVDEPSRARAATHITFTDVTAAEWLWRVVGAAGHVAVARRAGRRHASKTGGPSTSRASNRRRTALAPLRRLAVGHWLRRWWPASSRDGIVALDAAVLDGEIALLTVAAQDFFGEDTLDSDVAELLRPHRASLVAGAHGEDPRVAELVDCLYRTRRRTRCRRSGRIWSCPRPMPRAAATTTRWRPDRIRLDRAPPRSPAASARSTGRPCRPGCSTRPTTRWTGRSRWPDRRRSPRSGWLPRHPPPASRCGCDREPSAAPGVLDADGRATLALVGAERAAGDGNAGLGP